MLQFERSNPSGLPPSPHQSSGQAFFEVILWVSVLTLSLLLYSRVFAAGNRLYYETLKAGGVSVLR